MRLLIAEDDPRLLKSLMHVFAASGYAVDGVSNGNDAYNYALGGEYDGFVFDIMMPGRDGLQVLSELRKQGCSTPAMFLTARAEVSQRVEGLNVGADDYLPKPFATSELLARVEAMLRRRDAYVGRIIRFEGLGLDVASRRLLYGSAAVSLSEKEHQILEMLIQRPNTIVPIERIMLHVWGWDRTVETSALWVHVSNLRKKLCTVNAPFRIRFARNAGYVLEACEGEDEGGEDADADGAGAGPGTNADPAAMTTEDTSSCLPEGAQA